MVDLDLDGLCGVPFQNWNGVWLRCRKDMFHLDDHDWVRQRVTIRGAGLYLDDVYARAREGNHAAQAILGVPRDCTCRPLFAHGTLHEIIDWIFSPDCMAHEHAPPSGVRKKR